MPGIFIYEYGLRTTRTSLLWCKTFNVRPFLYGLQDTEHEYYPLRIFCHEPHPIKTISIAILSRYDPHTIRSLFRTNMCTRTFSYESFAIRASSVTNFSIQVACVLNLSVTSFLATNFIRYELFATRIFPVETFHHANIIIYEYLHTNICLRTFSYTNLVFKTLVREAFGTFYELAQCFIYPSTDYWTANFNNIASVMWLMRWTTRLTV